MPLSRKRKKQKRSSPYYRTSSRPPSGELKIEAMFDRAKLARRRLGKGRVLYHYTTWEAAENIIATQRFRATAHNCTNDPGELISADATIIEAFTAAQKRASGMTARLLRLFLKTYEHSRIGASPRCYLICFSETRDDPHQWCAYAARGSGVCLGLRLFEIPEPKAPTLASLFMPVQYVESDWRAKFDEWLDAFVAVFSRGTDTEHNWRLAMDSLTVTTSAWALTAKLPKWEPAGSTDDFSRARRRISAADRRDPGRWHVEAIPAGARNSAAPNAGRRNHRRAE
jgi:hypothetical protein